MRGYVLLLFVLLAAQPSFAGRIETVKETVKKYCSKDIDDNTALEYVKKMFLMCAPGQDVELQAGCRVKCLKENTGSIIGG